MDRRRYLGSRETLSALLDLGVVPIVNENDVIADDEIRFGDNDRCPLWSPTSSRPTSSCF